MDRAVTCILNEKSGSGRAEEARQLISRIAAEEGARARVLMIREGIEISERAVQARDAGDVVVAGGGDGTVSSVAAALVDTDTPFGVLPLGTLNHFAKDLNIPLELETAVRTLFTGRIARVDVGEVNGRVFLNNSSLGLYPKIVREREKQQRQGLRKWTAFVKATVNVLRRTTTLHVELHDDQGGILRSDSSFVFVGNNRYEFSGLAIGTRSALDGGRLWICMPPHAGRAKLFWLSAAALFGRINDADLIAFDTKVSLVRMPGRHVDVATDGEVSRMSTPLHYRIRPAALRVIVPATPNASSGDNTIAYDRAPV